MTRHLPQPILLVAMATILSRRPFVHACPLPRERGSITSWVLTTLISTFMLVGVLLWMVGASAPVERAKTGADVHIVCTTQMIADVARRVGGERCHVIALMGPGVDPHLYHPTRDDTGAMITADIVFYNGLHLEGKMTDLLERTARSRPVFAVTETLSHDDLITLSGQHDPHVWMDPVLWTRTIDVVQEHLSEIAPTGSPDFERNATALHREFAALHAYSQHVLDSVPERQRVLMTAHDAFSYFGRRYAFDVVGIQGISTESEAGLRDLALMIDTLIEQHVPAVFIESTVALRNIRALRAGAQAKGHGVQLGGMLFSDAAGPDGTYESSYVGMIDHNITTIARALGGDAPEGGMQGKLSPTQ